MTLEINSNVSGQQNIYERGLELAQAGQYEQALTCMQEHLRVNAGNAEVLNDTGVVLHCLGRPQEAVEYFIKARSIQYDSVEIMWNLAEAYLATGKASEAARLFDDMERTSVLNVDVLNRTANVFLNEGDKAGAIEMLLRSMQICPKQDVLLPMIQVIRSKRPKIAFFCGIDDMKFLNEIIEFTKERFEIRLFDGQSERQLNELMDWSDISWFEWCTNLAVMASKRTKVCNNIVRLHRFEAYTNWPSQVQWENIDFLITVGNTFVKDALLKQVPDIENRTQFCKIPNGVNLNKFKFAYRTPGKNLACIGYLNMRKNPMFLLQCMQKLHYIDPEYKLFIAGVFQDSMLEQYIRHMIQNLGLADVVFFNSWQRDVNSWLADKNYVVSSSISESQGMGLLEAMACGLKPIIHNFPGAEQIFPSEFLFNISEEFCEQVLSNTYEPERYRNFVEENYCLKTQLLEINNIFTRLEAEIDSQQTADMLINN